MVTYHPSLRRDVESRRIMRQVLTIFRAGAGMTCTGECHMSELLGTRVRTNKTLTLAATPGVAWSMGPEWPHPKTIQRWPGKLGHELRNKVDSCVSYDIHSGRVSTWGFLCNPDDEEFEYNSLFKLYLDPEHTDHFEDPPSAVETRTWYHDYLSCLHRYIIQHFEDSIPNFARKKVE